MCLPILRTGIGWLPITDWGICICICTCVLIWMYDPPYIERWYRMTGAYLAPPAAPRWCLRAQLGLWCPYWCSLPVWCPYQCPGAHTSAHTGAFWCLRQKTVDATVTAPLWPCSLEQTWVWRGGSVFGGERRRWAARAGRGAGGALAGGAAGVGGAWGARGTVKGGRRWWCRCW